MGGFKKSRAKPAHMKKGRKRRDPLADREKQRDPDDGLDAEGRRKPSLQEEKARILAAARQIAQEKREENARRQRAAISALVPTFDAATTNLGPKGYDWKLIFIAAYKVNRNAIQAREAAGVGYATVRNAKLEDPSFRAALEEIDAAWLEGLAIESYEVHQSVMDVARSVSEPLPLTGAIDPTRLNAAKMVLQAHQPALFGERVAVKVDATVSLPGAVMDAISRAAGVMCFESIPEADAVVVP